MSLVKSSIANKKRLSTLFEVSNHPSFLPLALPFSQSHPLSSISFFFNSKDIKFKLSSHYCQLRALDNTVSPMTIFLCLYIQNKWWKESNT